MEPLGGIWGAASNDAWAVGGGLGFAEGFTAAQRLRPTRRYIALLWVNRAYRPFAPCARPPWSRVRLRALTAYIVTQTPDPQRSPVAHCAFVEHVQNPSVHCPVGPHCEATAHVPQVPPTQAIPPPHWLFAVHAVHAPSMQTSPEGPWLGPAKPDTRLQSVNVEHGPHVLLTHAFPVAHSVPGRPDSHPLTGPGLQTPEEHD